MKLTIPGTLPSTNEILAASNADRHIYNEMKRSFTHYVSFYASQQLPELPKCNYEITWYCPDRRKDKDNITGGQKFIFDGLVKARKLPNDGWNNMGDISHRFEIDKDNPRVEVEIKEVS